MKKQERALRDRHTEVVVYGSFGLGAYCGGCAEKVDDRWTDEPWKYPYHCDAIKALSALKAVVHGGSELSTTREVCDHWVGVKGSGHYRYGSTTPPAYWTHNYCPKCGEKL